MKLIKKALFFVLSALFVASLFFNDIAHANAPDSPIISQCISNVNQSNSWVNVSESPVMQLIDVRLDHYKIDGIAVRLYTPNPDGRASISLRARNRNTILVKGVLERITQTPNWYYVDLEDIEIPRATYYVQATGLTQNIYWNYTTNSDCIDDSYMEINADNLGFSKDAGFAVYAYDASVSSVSESSSEDEEEGQAPDPSSTNPPTPVNTSEVTNEDKPQSNSAPNNNSTSTDLSNTAKNTSGYPSAEEIAALTKNNNQTPLGLMILIPAIGFIGLIVFIVWLWRRKPKKTEDQKVSK